MFFVEISGGFPSVQIVLPTCSAYRFAGHLLARLDRRQQRRVSYLQTDYLLPGLTVGSEARSVGMSFASTISTLSSIKLTNGHPKSGFSSPLQSTITQTATTLAPLLAHDADHFLDASAARDHILGDDKTAR